MRIQVGIWTLAMAMAMTLGTAATGDAQAANPVVVLETSQGTIKIELFEDEAPISTANFLSYADKGFYNDTVFHRVIPDFMIQGGGFAADMSRKQTDPAIKNEAENGLKNLRGTLAMARTQAEDSATAQFFINLKDNAFLDHGERGFGYAVFGKVTSGMDVVDKIAAVETAAKGGHTDVPVEPVLIKTAKRE
jgi:peptidyl-prolyl cis-trans isomerase A (cyclophilin A)